MSSEEFMIQDFKIDRWLRSAVGKRCMSDVLRKVIESWEESRKEAI